MKTQTRSSVKLCALGKKILRESLLRSGGHPPPDDLTKACPECVMELAAHIAMVCHLHPDAHWTDQDSTVDVCIGAFCRSLNDNFGDAERAMLKPYAPRLLFTKGSDALRQKRAYKCADFACRVIAPIALDFAKMDEQAAQLRTLSPIVDSATAGYAAGYAAAAVDAAGDAAGYAAAAVDAAGDAVKAAVYAAAAAVVVDAAAAARADLFKLCLAHLDAMIEATV